MARRDKEREELESGLASYVGRDIGPRDVGRDRVNEAMVRQWCDAMGDRNPVYRDVAAAEASVHAGLVAPPTMLQAWILPGLDMALGEDDPADKQKEQQTSVKGLLKRDKQVQNTAKPA